MAKLSSTQIFGNLTVDGIISTSGEVQPNLNAEKLEGKKSTDFSPANHNHNGQYIAKKRLTWNDLKGL